MPFDGAATMLFDYDNDGDKDIALDNDLSEELISNSLNNQTLHPLFEHQQ